MQQVRPSTAEPLTAVEVESILGDARFLTAHPAVHHVTQDPAGGLLVFVDATLPLAGAQGDHPPDRPPEVQLHGPGRPCEALIEHPLAEYVEVFVDALGDPNAAPRGWWHACVWLRAGDGPACADLPIA